MSDLIYTASVYQRTVKYVNFKNQTQEATLYFALDPMALMRVIAGFEVTTTKSGNPAKNGQLQVTDEAQVKFVRDLAINAAGWPSEDGESWEPFDGFDNTLAGKAFLTKLASSDGDRKEFAEKVILDPFRAFVGFAKEDPSNSKADVDQFLRILSQLENVFTGERQDESLEDRRKRLQAELEAMGDNE